MQLLAQWMTLDVTLDAPDVINLSKVAIRSACRSLRIFYCDCSRCSLFCTESAGCSPCREKIALSSALNNKSGYYSVLTDEVSWVERLCSFLSNGLTRPGAGVGRPAAIPEHFPSRQSRHPDANLNVAQCCTDYTAKCTHCMRCTCAPLQILN